MPAAIVMLDVDGVLVRGRPQDGQHFATDLERDLGISAPALQAAFFKPHWEAIVTGQKPLRESLGSVLAALAPNVTVDALTNYWFENDSRIDPAVLRDVEILRTSGRKVFLATNQEHMRASYLMVEMGLGAKVDGIFYSAALGHRKPAPEFYRLATARAAAAADEIILVDDALANVEAARQSGWRAVHWTDGMSLRRLVEEA